MINSRRLKKLNILIENSHINRDLFVLNKI